MSEEDIKTINDFMKQSTEEIVYNRLMIFGILQSLGKTPNQCKKYLNQTKKIYKKAIEESEKKTNE